eukprot:jgi/Astpho2/2496/Aster-x0537
MQEPPPTSAEQKCLGELKAELKQRGVALPKSMLPLDSEEDTMYRFLRARKFNVEAAADMLQNTVKWRAENDIEDTLAAFLPDGKDDIVRKHIPSGFVGFDKSGQPMWMEHVAGIDVIGMQAAGVTLDDYVFYSCRPELLSKPSWPQAMEYMINCKYPEAAQLCGHPVTTHSIILDLGGLRMSMLNANTLSVFKAMSAIYQDHYPELMTRMFLVNIPLVFAAVWRVLQMFVDDRVKAKIRFLRKADLGTLHEFIDRDLLPENLGGKFSGRVLSDKTGFVPPSLRAVDAEIERRLDAKAAAKAAAAGVKVVADAALHGSESRMSMDAESVASCSLPENLTLPSEVDSPTRRLQEVDSFTPVSSTTDLVGMEQEVQVQSRPLSPFAATEMQDREPPPVSAEKALKARRRGREATPDRPRQSRRQRRKEAAAQKKVAHIAARQQSNLGNKALEMLADMRRINSTPNVEQAAIEQTARTGGGPWMSFTRQRRKPHEPRESGRRRRRSMASNLQTVTTATAAEVDAQVEPRPEPREQKERRGSHLFSGGLGLRAGSKRWKGFCSGQPAVLDDDEGASPAIRAHLTGGCEAPQRSGPPPTAAAASSALKPALKKRPLDHPSLQRLAVKLQASPPESFNPVEGAGKKLSAIPVYMQQQSGMGNGVIHEQPTAREDSSMRIPSGLPSWSTATGPGLVGRYASAPNLPGLASDSSSLERQQLANRSDCQLPGPALR